MSIKDNFEIGGMHMKIGSVCNALLYRDIRINNKAASIMRTSAKSRALKDKTAASNANIRKKILFNDLSDTKSDIKTVKAYISRESQPTVAHFINNYSKGLGNVADNLANYRDLLLSGKKENETTELEESLQSLNGSANVNVSNTDASVSFNYSKQVKFNQTKSKPPEDDTSVLGEMPQKFIDEFFFSCSTVLNRVSERINTCSNAYAVGSTEAAATDKLKGTKAEGGDMFNITTKSLGLDDVGTDTAQVVKRIDNAIDILRSYSKALDNTLSPAFSESQKILIGSLDIKA